MSIYPAYLIEYPHIQSGKTQQMVVLGDGSVDVPAKAAKHHGIIKPLVLAEDYEALRAELERLQQLVETQVKEDPSS